MKISKLKLVALSMIFVVMLAGCGQSNQSGTSPEPVAEPEASVQSSNEDLFQWDENMIYALTDEGKAQKSIVVPARCEGFTDAVFSDCEVENVSFEDDDDLDISVAFTGSGVKHVELPANVTVIPSMAFQMCTNLESVKLPAALTTMEDYAFNGCENLTNVEFSGNQLLTIPKNCFENCKALEEITIPDGVETISSNAFFNSGKLANVTLPDSLKTVEGNAFGNTAIEELRLPAGITDLNMDSTAFGMNTYTMKVIIPAGSWLDENRDAWATEFGEIVTE